MIRMATASFPTKNMLHWGNDDRGIVFYPKELKDVIATLREQDLQYSHDKMEGPSVPSESSPEKNIRWKRKK